MPAPVTLSARLPISSLRQEPGPFRTLEEVGEFLRQNGSTVLRCETAPWGGWAIVVAAGSLPAAMAALEGCEAEGFERSKFPDSAGPYAVSLVSQCDMHHFVDIVEDDGPRHYE